MLNSYLSNKNKKIIIALLLFVAISLFIAYQLTIEKPPEKNEALDFRKTNLSYYEFVYEDLSCEGKSCLTEEYIVFSNGLVFEKNEAQSDEKEKAEIRIGTIEKNEAEKLIGYAKNIPDGLNAGGIDCNDCQLFHVFYGDQIQTKAITKRVEDAPESMRKIKEMTEKALEKLESSNPSFVHLVFEPKGESAIDYHFYPDGTVLKEYFGVNNGDLLSSAIYSLNSEETAELTGMIKEDYFKSTDNMEECVKTDLSWGYLEVKKGDAYRTVFTCGTGQSGADKLFKELLNKTGGK